MSTFFADRKEVSMFVEGDVQKLGQTRDVIPKHKFGIYSIKLKETFPKGQMLKLRKAADTLSRILHKVDTMKIDDQTDENSRNGIDSMRDVTNDLIKVRMVRVYVVLGNNFLKFNSLCF